MEKLNNGCEHCKGSRDAEISKKKRAWRPLICPKCKRNITTGNQMIEVEPLEFPSWEEFEKISSYEVAPLGHYMTLIIMNDEIRCGIYEILEGNKPSRKFCRYSKNQQGYRQACEEIERIRKQFVIELCKG